MGNKLPWFKFYPTDFYMDENVRLMSHEEKGIFIELLSAQWIEGSIPADENRLMKMLKIPPEKWPGIWKNIRPCFIVSQPGRLGNPKLTLQQRERKRKNKLFTDSGKRGANKRWNKDIDSPPIGPPSSTEWGGYDSATIESEARSKKIEEEEEEEKRGSPPPPSSDDSKKSDKKQIDVLKDPGAFVELWNDSARISGVPKIQNMGKERVAKFKSRIKDSWWMNNWHLAIDKIETSDFLQGKNNRKWKANADWFLANNTNVVGIMEGKYDDNGQE